MNVPVNMQAVAVAAGVHRTTVSLALRDSPRLPEETRARIRAAAKALGYRPDPLVSALMTARAGRKRRAVRAVIACVGANAPANGGRGDGAYARMSRGARERAREQGYAVSFLRHPAGTGMSSARFTGMLAARGVQGLLIAPGNRADLRLDLDWSRFAVVELGYNLAEPAFHGVVHDYFHAMKRALAEARVRGRRRIGFVMPAAQDAKSHHLWRAAYLDAQQGWPARERLPILGGAMITEELMEAWIARARPDAVCAIGSSTLPGLRRVLGGRFPREVGFVDLACHDREGGNAGIYQNWEQMGAAAVDTLVAMLNRGERGVPEFARHTLTAGVWVNGATLPPGGSGGVES